MISEIILAGLGYAYLRRQYQTSPTLQTIVKRGKEVYQHHARPVIEVAEYGDGTGTVRSRVSNFAGWVNWEVVGQDRIRASSELKRYPTKACQEIAANLKKHYETEYAREQAAATLVNKQVIRTE